MKHTTGLLCLRLIVPIVLKQMTSNNFDAAMTISEGKS